MFGKLHKKIYLTLFILPTAFVVLLSSLTFGFVYNYLDDDYANAAVESVSLASTNFNFYMDILSSDLRLLADDVNVIAYAKDASSPVVAQNKLNAAVNSDSSILGITLYGTAADVHIASTGVSGYSLLNELETEQATSDFMNETSEQFLLLRNRFIPDNFEFVSYDESYGILSYYLKVYEADTVCGLLVADLDTEYIYSTFFNYEKYDAFKSVTSLIANGSLFLKSGDNASMGDSLTLDTTQTLTRITRGHSYLKTDLMDGYVLISVFDDAYRASQSWILAASILAMDTLLILGSLLVTRKAAKQILSPLNDIVEKMKKQSAD